ncbi:hypothetical protein pETSU_207 [Edwardsiella phage pEt-SU]|uniref:Uncharacterized protein n=1 Tax=Edwardsiella phage pEt-SU TaxID=2562142 RepID=A0A4D6DX49_9CAUD|nr:hypothetical protein HOV39_gp207 [Edwardsiella phage pEt-SU]QBZ70788.1 hypothetical protein pETSU_207 [Edwardsiella phage pEt-SU]
MLKDKSCYATETAYARAYFLHKSKVQDYLMDPVYGSHIRVITPTEDQPTPVEGKGYYTRPQFCLISSVGASRLYEMDEIPKLLDGVRLVIKSLDVRGKTDIHFGGSNSKYPALFTSDWGALRFTTMQGSSEMFVTGVLPSKSERFTAERHKTILTNLHDSLQLIIDGKGPKEKILKLDNEIFTVLPRKDQGIRIPVRISALRGTAPGITTIRIGSHGQLICLPINEAADVFNRYMENAVDISERLLAAGSPAGYGEVKFNGNGPDINMEYVNARIIPLKTGDSAFVILNSDRYPGNTKLGFHYDPEFCKELNEAFQEVVKQMKGML